MSVDAPASPAASPLGLPLPAWIALAGALVRLVLAAAVPLTTDEAYYVDWARHLSAGYLDHPPAVAWLLAGGLRLLGENPLAVRLPAIALQAIATLLAADLARARAGGRAAVIASLALQAAPVFSLGAMLMTPDAALTLAWIGVLWATDRAVRRDPRWWLAAGAWLGLAALSKLTAGLLGLGVLAALVATADGRRALRSPWPWAGALLALAIASPFLAWNAARGWPSLGFQARHGLGGGNLSLARVFGSIGAQAAYVSPVLLVLAFSAALRTLRRRADAGETALAFTALPVVAFFTAAAAAAPALPHWPAPGWLSATILLAIEGAPFLRPALWIGVASSAVVVGALGLPIAPLDELRGWGEGAKAARAVAGDARLAAAHWIVLGHLGWEDGRSPAYVGARASGPTFYEPDPLTDRRPLLIVTVDGLGEQRADLEARLGRLTPAGETVARGGARTIRTYRFWRWGPTGH